MPSSYRSEMIDSAGLAERFERATLIRALDGTADTELEDMLTQLAQLVGLEAHLIAVHFAWHDP